jgi:hypothetical protein
LKLIGRYLVGRYSPDSTDEDDEETSLVHLLANVVVETTSAEDKVRIWYK